MGSRNHFRPNLMLILGLLSILLLAGCTNQSQFEWKCSVAECAEFVDGQTWAKDNCIQNGEDVVCPVLVEGTQVLVPIEQINLSAVNQCVKYVCVEEAPFRTANYSINITAI